MTILKLIVSGIVLSVLTITIGFSQVPPPPVAVAATSISGSTFSANWTTTATGVNGYILDVNTSSTFDLNSYVPGYFGTYVNGAATLTKFVSPLTPGTTYYYRVQQTGSWSTTGWSNTISVTTLPLPAAPVAIAAASITNNSFTAKWNSVSGATVYRLDVSTSNLFTTLEPGYNNLVVSGTSQGITGLIQGTMYYYRVRTQGPGGISLNSNTITTLTSGAPPTPVANNATNVTTTSFTANWAGLSGATSYRLDVSLSSTFASFVTGYNNLTVTSTNQSVTGLSLGNTYYYRVRAVNASGTSGSSATITVLPLPSIPTAINATNVTPTSFTANWYSAPNASEYRLDVSTTSNFSSLYLNNLSVAGTSFDVTNLTNRTTYYYRVRGVNSSGTSANSNIIFAAHLDKNYVKVTTVNVSGKTTGAQAESSGVNEAATAYTFLDGLGRQIQTVLKQNSPLQNDIVQPNVYDFSGRESKKYLPISMGTDGWIKNVTYDATGNYTGGSGNTYGNNINGKIAQDTRPFAETIYEKSPLNRPLRSYGAGVNWKNGSNDKYVQYQYLSNTHNTGVSTTGEKIISWQLDANDMPIRRATLAGAVVAGGYFVGSQLSIKVVVDEQGNAVREYTNKSGQVVLKKVQVASSVNLNSTAEWAMTYYLYDDFGNLRYVFQPELSKAIHDGADTYVVSTTQLNNYAFQYDYDARKRMTLKQVPGADPLYMVYDNRDRLVLSQDGNQRANKYWLYTKYDFFNRPIITGIYTHSDIVDQPTMQSYVNTQVVSGNQFYEDYDGTTAMHGYTNRVFPNLNTEILTVTYYDTYAFKSLLGSSEYDFKSTQLPIDNVNNYPGQVTTAFNNVIGQITGTKIKLLNTNTFLKSVIYYDNRYRTVQTISDNIKGYTVTTNIYDFVGKVLRTKSSLFLGQPVIWANLTGVQLTGNVIASTGTTTWAQGATSSQTLPANADGWTEVAINNSNPEVEFGLTDAYVSPAIANIDYGWYLNKNQLSVYENGSQVWSSTYVNPGDVLRVERVNGVVYYKHNGLVCYKSLTASTTVLIVQVSFKNSGSKLSQGRVSNTFNGSAVAAEESSFIKRFNYDHTGRLTKTWHSIKGNSEILLANYIYNELGQLIDKKLYNTDIPSVADNSRIFKQSVDFRYNIRGWITSINNSALVADASNDDASDFFGINLLYEQTDAGIINTGLYNGNISGMKWSSNLGLGDIKQTGYNFTYDALNRLTNANSRMSKTNVWQTGYYDEKGLSYDLNGNIKSLTRNGDAGATIDDLTYNFGSGTAASNRLLSVTDGTLVAADKVKGFTDGSTVGNDYTYDLNGNLLTDKNKGLTVPITYNHLNLPTTILKSYSNINYTYDAGGIKHSQVTTYGTTQKFTEYVGPWIYENNELQFLQHDEGRIVLTSQQQKYKSTCDAATDLTNTPTTITLSTFASNGEEYIQVTPAVGTNLSKIGVIQIGSVLTVSEGERYMFRVKGFNNGSPNANLYVKNNTTGTDVLWPGAALPNQAVNESWVEESFTIPPGVTQIVFGVVFNSSAAATASTIFYLNDIEIYKKLSSAPEYQYDLKDHLGNVRLTFTTQTTAKTYTAGFETANQNVESADFNHYPSGGGLINTVQANAHSGSNSELLNGGVNGQVGVTKSFSVMPGDVMQIEAYVKYGTESSTNTNVTGLASTLLSAFNLSAPGVGEIGTPSTGVQTFGAWEIGASGDESKGDPIKAFVTIFLFDRNYNFLDVAYDAPSSSGDLVSASYVVKQAGYAYVYISNEHPKLLDVYFDDVKVTYTPSAIIASNDYYPFGLTYNSYLRENSVKQNYQYNGKEVQDELSLNWLDFGRRMYQPELARFFAQDRFTEKFLGLSPYQFGANNPIVNKDINGDFIVSIHYQMTYDILKKYGYGDAAADAGSYYASYYADRPSANITRANNFIANSWGMSKVGDRPGWNDNETINSQDTSSPIESRRHSMEADYENIGSLAAKKRGQEFGWSKVFDAAKQGDPSTYKKGSKAAKAFGVGVHALQDSKAHEGVKMAQHDIDKDMGQGETGLKAYQNGMDITESAVLVVEMLNGNYSNIKDDTTIEISGMNKNQLYQVIDAAFKTKKKITFKNEYKDY